MKKFHKLKRSKDNGTEVQMITKKVNIDSMYVVSRKRVCKM